MRHHILTTCSPEACPSIDDSTPRDLAWLSAAWLTYLPGESWSRAHVSIWSLKPGLAKVAMPSPLFFRLSG